MTGAKLPTFILGYTEQIRGPHGAWSTKVKLAPQTIREPHGASRFDIPARQLHLHQLIRLKMANATARI